MSQGLDHYKSRLLPESVYTGCQNFKQKKMQKTDAMVDQNLDAHNRPNDSAPFNDSLQIQVNFEQKKDKTEGHGGPQSKSSEPSRQFSPFQQITTNPGYCMNLSLPSAQLPIRISNKKRRN